MVKVYNKYHKDYPEDAIYIGRGSDYGNPFIIGKDGTRKEVIEKYINIIESNENLKNLIIQRLKGKNLLCYCSPKSCHGDYLLKIANE
jgi:hypothetical protein